MLTVSRSAVDFSGLGGIWDGPSHSGKRVLWSDESVFQVFFGRNGRRVWHILKRKMRQRRPRTVAHLKTCLQEEWAKLHLKHFITWCLQSLNVF